MEKKTETTIKGLVFGVSGSGLEEYAKVFKANDGGHLGSLPTA